MTATDPAQLDNQPQPLDTFRQDRIYLGANHRRNEQRTWIVTAICAAALVAQLAGGVVFKSMALTAAGLHMAAHVAVLLVAVAAYRVARRYATDPRFAFGTGKVGDLAGFANAVVLAITAIFIGAESIERIFHPEGVHYHGATPLAAAGLAVTVLCVVLLKPHHSDRGQDLNISAAHLHLTADAMIGVLAIAGLAAGEFLGWTWADPAAGLAGAFLVAQFAVSLGRKAAAALLDMNPSPELNAEIRARLGAEGETVADLHFWRLGPGHHAAVAVVSADHPQDPGVYHARLRGLEGLSHVTVEVRGTAHVHDHSCHAHG